MSEAVMIPVPAALPPDPADDAYAFATQGVEDPHALNLPSVVEGLVRAYGAEVMQARAGWVAGTSPQEEAVALIQAGARQLNDIFMGRVADYRTQPWNSPGQLGAYLAERCHLEVPPGESVAVLAEIFAQHLVAVTGYGAAGLWPTALVFEDLKRSVQVFQACLMGLPVVAPAATPEEPYPPLIIPTPGRGQ